MFIKDNKRINIYAPYVREDGTRFQNLTDPSLRETEGVVEISEPAPPEDYSEETHYRTEQDEAPYVVYTPKSPEQIEQNRKDKIRGEIETLERQQLLPRAVREFMLLYLEANFPPEVLTANPGYKAVKAFDNLIASKRNSL